MVIGNVSCDQYSHVQCTCEVQNTAGEIVVNNVLIVVNNVLDKTYTSIQHMMFIVYIYTPHDVQCILTSSSPV